MKISIDAVWLDKNQRVVHIETNLQPDAYPYKQYTPSQPAEYIVEMAAGQVSHSKIKLGDEATLNLKAAQ